MSGLASHHMEIITEAAERIASASDTERNKQMAMQEGRKLHLEFEKERFLNFFIHYELYVTTQ